MRTLAILLLCAVSAGLGYFGYAANDRYKDMQMQVETAQVKSQNLEFEVEKLKKSLHQAELDHERVVSELETKLGDAVSQRDTAKAENDVLLERISQQLTSIVDHLNEKPSSASSAAESKPRPRIQGLKRAPTPEEEARMLNELSE